MSQVRFLLTTISSVLKSKELDRLTICIFKMLTNISRCLKFGQKVFLGQTYFRIASPKISVHSTLLEFEPKKR